MSEVDFEVQSIILFQQLRFFFSIFCPYSSSGLILPCCDRIIRIVGFVQADLSCFSFVVKQIVDISILLKLLYIVALQYGRFVGNGSYIEGFDSLHDVFSH